MPTQPRQRKQNPTRPRHVRDLRVGGARVVRAHNRGEQGGGVARPGEGWRGPGASRRVLQPSLPPARVPRRAGVAGGCSRAPRTAPRRPIRCPMPRVVCGVPTSGAAPNYASAAPPSLVGARPPPFGTPLVWTWPKWTGRAHSWKARYTETDLAQGATGRPAAQPSGVKRRRYGG